MIKVLIAGANSYIGQAVEQRLNDLGGYEITVLDMIDGSWKQYDFSQFDTVFHVAAIVHDLGKTANEQLYYDVNYKLAIDTAAKAKSEGVKQFIFMSSMAVYGGVKENCICEETAPKVNGCYGDSKLKADIALQHMADDNFVVAIMRPPMIFGKNCKGNFPRLAGFARKTPIFPEINNKRSMLYIENFAEAVRIIIDNRVGGIFYPQNSEYFSTTSIVKTIAAIYGKKIWFTKLFNLPVAVCKRFVGSFNKVFGDLTYDKAMSDICGENYCLYDNNESLTRSVSKEQP